MKGIVYDDNLRVIAVIDESLKDGNVIKGRNTTMVIGPSLRYARVKDTDVKEGDVLPAPIPQNPYDIDYETGKAIDKAVHPFAGQEEQIGILRDQIVQIINTLGLTPTKDFARLNEIAIKAVEESAKKKAAL